MSLFARNGFVSWRRLRNAVAAASPTGTVHIGTLSIPKHFITVAFAVLGDLLASLGNQGVISTAGVIAVTTLLGDIAAEYGFKN